MLGGEGMLREEEGAPLRLGRVAEDDLLGGGMAGVAERRGGRGAISAGVLSVIIMIINYDNCYYYIIRGKISASAHGGASIIVRLVLVTVRERGKEVEWQDDPAGGRWADLVRAMLELAPEGSDAGGEHLDMGGVLALHVAHAQHRPLVHSGAALELALKVARLFGELRVF